MAVKNWKRGGRCVRRVCRKWTNGVGWLHNETLKPGLEEKFWSGGAGTKPRGRKKETLTNETSVEKATGEKMRRGNRPHH